VSRYERAAEIFEAALELPHADRPSFVVQQSNGDESLREDVLSLLAAHERSDGFLDRPTTIGAYRILGVLGEGGMGVVYLAEDPRLGRKVALKAIARKFTNDAHARERLRREARAAAALVHPGIAVVYSLEEIDGSLFIVSEHLQGETLRDAIAGGPLPLPEVISIGRQLAGALAAAHDSGVIHRDLKPENVMRTRDGAVKILDFGLAKAPVAMASGATADAPSLTAAGAVFGTPAYMSPEQLRGEPAGPASDIFSLGVLLAELSSGHHPFGGERGPATMARVVSSEPDLAGVPPALCPVIIGCVTKLPDERFRSAHEVRAAIETVARGETPRLGDRANAFWWWQFHQAGACVFSAVMIVGVWLASGQLPAEYADEVVIGALIGGVAATTLRLYIWFSARMRPSESTPRGAIYAARAADAALAATAFLAGFHQRIAHPIAAGFLMAAAVVMTLVSLVVEPATQRAARR
jgi:hypothetical protein